MTRYFLERTGTCSLHDVSSQVHPCTRMTVLVPWPVEVEWIWAPSIVAARIGDASSTSKTSENVTSIQVFISITLQASRIDDGSSQIGWIITANPEPGSRTPDP